MKKIKWVKKIERISDAGDIKESIYKPENCKGDISIETVKKAIRLQSGSSMNMTTKEFLETANEEMSRKVWEHYGKETQKKKFIEELSELITALAKEDRRAIGEEMADVKVMIMQFENGMEIDTLPIMNYKLHRQLARIENENNNK